MSINRKKNKNKKQKRKVACLHTAFVHVRTALNSTSGQELGGQCKSVPEDMSHAALVRAEPPHGLLGLQEWGLRGHKGVTTMAVCVRRGPPALGSTGIASESSHVLGSFRFGRCRFTVKIQMISLSDFLQLPEEVHI